MSPTPTPTPTPPYPPLDLTHAEPSSAERIADAIEHINATSTTDLDALIALTETSAPFSLTVTADPGALGGLLVIGALVGIAAALAVYAVRRVTSPEARARRASKRAATHALYTDLIHDKRERAVKARIEERRARDEAADVDVSSGTP